MSSLNTTDSASNHSLSFVKLCDMVLATLSKEGASPESLESLRKECITALTDHSSSTLPATEQDAVCRIVEAFLHAGLMDFPSDDATVEEANKLAQNGWKGLLAALLMVPAWQLRNAPAIEKIPYSLWPLYTECLFRIPIRALATGQIDAMARHYTCRLSELLRLAESNRGSSAVRGALEKYQKIDSIDLLFSSGHSALELLSLQGRLYSSIHKASTKDGTLILPREGRKMRVGYVVASLGDGKLARWQLPWLENLDTNQFETILFALGRISPMRHTQLAGKVLEIRDLPGTPEEGVSALSDAMLDLAVFMTDVGTPADPVNRLAIHRVAPLQICIDPLGPYSGIPQADLVIADMSDKANLPPAKCHERSALIPSQGLSFSSTQGLNPSTCEWTREGLLIPEDAVVLSSVAPFAQITPETLETWMGILTRAPKTSLLIYSYDTRDDAHSLSALSQCVSLYCTSHQIDTSRILISNEPLPSLAEVIELLKLSDLYLDTIPRSFPEGCELATKARVPVLCVKATSINARSFSGELEAIGLGRCSFKSGEEYAEQAVYYAMHPTDLNEFKADLSLRTSSFENIGDAKAFGESLGEIFRTSFDALYDQGRPAFRSNKGIIEQTTEDTLELSLKKASTLCEMGNSHDAHVLLAKSIAMWPRSEALRLKYYELLIEVGLQKRAADGLLSLVEKIPSRSDLWFLLSKALFKDGNHADVISTLETALRLDEKNLEGWLFLADITIRQNHRELMTEVRSVLLQLSAGDQRVMQTVDRLDKALSKAGVEQFSVEPEVAKLEGNIYSGILEKLLVDERQ